MAILVSTVRRGVEGNKTEEEIKKILKEANRNGDGSLNKEELKYAFRRLGSRVPGWRAYQYLRRADHNRDGVINGEEVIDLIKYALSKYGYKMRK